MELEIEDRYSNRQCVRWRVVSAVCVKLLAVCVVISPLLCKRSWLEENVLLVKIK